MRVNTSDIHDAPKALMNEPLEWFLAEHYRHRQFCRVMNDLAEAGSFQAEPLRKLIDFLRDDVPLHFADEEADLFPRLRRRAEPEDRITEVLDMLTSEHKADLVRIKALCERLEAALESGAAPGADPETRAALQGFASDELRHLALENAVVLSIARLRLRPEDVAAISRGLAARRGVPRRRMPA